MAKSAKKDLQAKKRRAKRREALKVTPTYPWDDIDVSAWFDTRFLIDEETGERFDNCVSGNGLYEVVVPAELNLNYWANAHADEEKESRAALLASSFKLAREKAGKSPDPEERARYAAQKEADLKELKRLADEEDSVTANAVLGSWCAVGSNVRKNTVKAKKHLLKAAEAGDPYSCFCLAHAGYCPERTEELYRKSREGGCPSAFIVQAVHCLHGRRMPAAEVELMASYLAAFAAQNFFPCLSLLVQLMRLPAGASLREAYAAPMTELLRRAASQGSVNAVEQLADVLSDGRLCEMDAEAAKTLYKEAMQKGSSTAGVQYARLLLREAQDLPQQEKSSRMQEAYGILRENCREHRQAAESYALLGQYLTQSDDDQEFQEGMDCLQKCLAYNNFEEPLECVPDIVERQRSHERCVQALGLLELMVQKGNARAKFLKGAYCLMGLCGGEDRKRRWEQGLALLLEAAQNGQTAAWGELAAVYALGICGVRQSLKKALDMAEAGERAGDDSSRFWRMLIELGEFSKQPKSASGRMRGPDIAAMEFCEFLAGRDSFFIRIMDDLLWVGAAKVSGRARRLYDLGRMPSLVKDYRDLMDNAIESSRLCAAALKFGQVTTVGFYLYALKRFIGTKYGRLYASAAAVRMGMSADTSPAAVVKALQDYLKEMPESYCKFRDKNIDEDPDEDKLHRLAAYMLAIRPMLCAEAAGRADEDKDEE